MNVLVTTNVQARAQIEQGPICAVLRALKALLDAAIIEAAPCLHASFRVEACSTLCACCSSAQHAAYVNLECSCGRPIPYYINSMTAICVLSPLRFLRMPSLSGTTSRTRQ